LLNNIQDQKKKKISRNISGTKTRLSGTHS